MIELEGGPLYQWDTGRKLLVDDPVEVVCFARRGDGASFGVEPEGNACPIPDEMLQRACDVFVWAESGGRTVARMVLQPRPRAKPDDYFPEPMDPIQVKELKEWVLDQIGQAIGEGGGISSAEAEQLPEGAAPTASVEGGVLRLGIPRGEPGSSIRQGTGAPSVGGRLGDLYVDASTGALYEYQQSGQ